MSNQWSNSPDDFEKLISEFKKGMKFFIPIISLIIIFIAGTTTYYTVEPDEEAVVVRLGKYMRTDLPGLHFKVPFGVDRVIKVKTKRILQAEFGFRTRNASQKRTQYNSSGFELESLMLTGDLNVADVQWVVQYQIADPFKFIFQTSSPETNIRDVSESIMRRVVGDRPVTEVLTTGRVEIAAEAKGLMQSVLDRYDMGVKIVAVKLQDVNPPHSVKPSFNEVNAAKQEQEKMINQAEEAYNRLIPEAKGKAEKRVSEAKGEAEALINRAKGDSQKFMAVLVEYRRAKEITKKRIYLDTMQKLFSKLENVTIVDPKIKGLLPVYSKLGGVK